MKAASSRVNAVNAMLRTTTAVTMIQGGTKDNVLPQEATAIVNMRIMPGESIESAVSRTKRVINDPKVEVSIAGEASNPTGASRLDSRGFRMLDRTIKETVPESVIVPYLVLGMTDSRHYAQISDAVFRFCPIRVGREDQDLAHGTDERIKVNNFGEFIEFYERLIRNSSPA
jgi:carboxypeptidase PM20D1